MANPTPVGFTLDTSKPELAQAASLALGILKLAKTATWKSLAEGLTDPASDIRANLARLVLTDDQEQLLDRHADVLNHLHFNPIVTVAVCADCGSWVLVNSSDTKPSMCRMSMRCGSKDQVKAIGLTAKPIAPPEDPPPAPSPPAPTPNPQRPVLF